MTGASVVAGEPGGASAEAAVKRPLLARVLACLATPPPPPRRHFSKSRHFSKYQPRR